MKRPLPDDWGALRNQGQTAMTEAAEARDAVVAASLAWAAAYIAHHDAPAFSVEIEDRLLAAEAALWDAVRAFRP